MNRSLYKTITIGLVVLVAIISIFATIITYWLLSYRSKLAHEQKAVEFIGFLQQSLSTPIWEVDDEGVKSICAAFAEHETVSLLRVQDVSGNVLFDKSNEESAIWARKSAKIIYQENSIGSIELGLTPKSYEEISFQLFIASVFTMLLVLTGLVIGINLFLQKILKRPLDQLIKCTHQVSKGEFHPLEESSPYEEVTTILNSFSQMVEAIYHREAELASANKKLAFHVENTPLGVIEWDLNFRVTKWNKASEQIFGYSKSEAIGRTGLDLIVPKGLRPLVEEIWKDLVSGKGGRKSTNENINKNGDLCISDWYNTTLFGEDGNPIGVASLVLDITKRTQAEEEQKKLESQLRQSHKMEAIGTIAGGIAHDFNNILGIIIGNMELAIDTIEDGNPAHANLDAIKKASLRASDVVKQLLNFSREAEHSKIPIDIGSIVKESIIFLRSSIPTSIEIESSIPESLTNIIADSTQIHQVLINLCTNAAHSMEKDGGILKIDLSEVELDNVTKTQFQEIDAGHYIQLIISDTGHGIDSKTKAKIFDPYFTTKDVGKGTGMGLAVVLGIVQNHNGAILLYSEPGEGSTFKVLFPATGEKTIKEEIDSKALPKGNETILFIDDEVGLTEIGRDLLERLGYNIVTKTDPVKALDLYRSDPSRFDLIITDMTMPHLTGDQLIKEILKIDSKMPVILCTGFSNKIDMEKAIKIGAQSYIEKPLDKNQLAYSVRKALDVL